MQAVIPVSTAPSVQAYRYKADSTDMMDMAMSWSLCKLDARSSSSLRLRRLLPGLYEIDGRKVSVRWHDHRHAELLAREDDVPTAEAVPLADYLRQASHVANSLAVPVINLHHVSGPNDMPSMYIDAYADEDDERVMAMARACKEAGLPRPNGTKVSL